MGYYTRDDVTIFVVMFGTKEERNPLCEYAGVLMETVTAEKPSCRICACPRRLASPTKVSLLHSTLPFHFRSSPSEPVATFIFSSSLHFILSRLSWVRGAESSRRGTGNVALVRRLYSHRVSYS
jgi:hypothetical protein